MLVRRLWLTPILLLGLNACSDSTSQLTFAPQDGETRAYRSLSDTRIGLASAQGFVEEERFQTSMFTEYRVERVEDGHIIHIQPELFRLESRGESIISFHQPSPREEELRSLMREGFQLELDAQHQPIAFIINAELDVLANDTTSPITGMLDDTLSHPAIAQGIKLHKGAEIKIPARDLQPELTATIVKIEHSNAHIRLQGENESVKVFGHIVSDTESGWIDRGTIVTNMRKPMYDDIVEVHMAMTILPDDWPWEIDLDYLDNYQNHSMPTLESLHTIESQPSLEQLLENATRKIDQHRGGLYLVLEHDVAHINEVGDIQFSNAQAFNDEGELLSLDLKLDRAATYDLSVGGARYIETMAAINPLGWDDVHLKLAELAYVDVTVNWSSYDVEPVELTPSAHVDTTQVGDANATLTPTENDGEFTLYLESGTRTHFEQQIKTQGNVSFEFMAYEAAPDWLSLGEKRLLVLLEHGTYPAYYRINFEGNPPSPITVSAIHQPYSIETQQSLRFEKHE